MNLKAKLAAQDQERRRNGHTVELAEYGFDDAPPFPGFDVLRDGMEETMRKIESRVQLDGYQLTFRELAEKFPRLHDPVIDGLIRQRETANIISVSKIGKSWLAYSLILSFICCRLWLGRFGTAGGKVLLIDNELHRPTIAYRINEVARAMGILFDDFADSLTVWALRGMGKNIFDLEHDLATLPPDAFQLCILDAKYRALPGGTSENDNTAETMFYNTVDRIAETCKFPMVLIHHSTKGSQSEKRVTDVGAGGGAQSRAADCHLVLREHEEEGIIVLDAAVRSFAPVEPLALRWEFPLWVPAEGIDPSALKGRLSPNEERQNSRDAESDSIILRECQTWRSRRELRTATGWSEDRVNRTVRRLLDANLLEQGKEKRRGNECAVFRKTIHAN